MDDAGRGCSFAAVRAAGHGFSDAPAGCVTDTVREENVGSSPAAESFLPQKERSAGSWSEQTTKPQSEIPLAVADVPKVLVPRYATRTYDPRPE